MSVVVSITPRNDCPEELKTELRAFRRELEEFDPKELGAIIEDVSFLPLLSSDIDDELWSLVGHILKLMD